MKNVKRTFMIVLSATLLAIWSVPCYAAEGVFKEVFQDAVYGGLTGALVGAAVMAFTHKPGDHFDYIGYGGAGGVLVGAAVGMLSTAKSLAEVDHGKVRFAFPTIIPDFQEPNSKGQTAYVINAQLLRGNF
jgi:hypothetical protein